MTAPFRNHAEEIDAAVQSEFQRIVDSRNVYLIREYAETGKHVDLYGEHRISEAARQMLVGYLRQAEAYARHTPIAEPTDRYGRVTRREI